MALPQPAEEIRALVELDERARPARTASRVLATDENEVDACHVEDDDGHVVGHPVLRSPPFHQLQLATELRNHAAQQAAQVEPAPALTQVLEIVPDVEPAYAQKLIDAHIGTYGADHVVQSVLHLLFEDRRYPHAQKEKRKAVYSTAEKEPKRARIDYASVDRPFTGGSDYVNAALVRILVCASAR